MDLEAAMLRIDGVKKKEHEEKGDKTLYIAPFSGELPNDGMLRYAQVVSVYDFDAISDRTVALVAEADFDMLTCVAMNQALFGVNLIVMAGVPNSDYSPAFESATWNLDRLGYAAFLSELSMALEAERQIAASSESAYDKEKKQYTRSGGGVKKHQALLYSQAEIEGLQEPNVDDVADEGDEDA